MTPTPATAAGDLEHRVLLRTVTARDAAMTIEVLRRAGMHGVPVASLEQLIEAMAQGAGAVLLAEEALIDPGFARFREALHSQPPWSDLPVTLLARSGADSPLVAQAMELRANITVVERPLRVSALVSTLRSALRTRARQYEMRAVLQALEVADQRKNEFLATLAHELRNPLAPISTGLTILRHGKADAEVAENTLAMMQRQLAHMTRLIDDLMQVSRITRGKIELQREVLALDRVLAEAIESSLPLVESKRHTLEVSLPEDRWLADADGVRLTQVFANLVTNAAKYSPPGSRIEIRLEREGEQAVVRVRDNGDGIAPERLDDIFGMFVQVGDRTRESQGGLGIGLTLCESLVRLHGGSIEARSEGLGRGSEFIVRLPLARGAALPRHKPPALPGAQRLSRRVLVVDDNRDAADALAFLLNSMGADAHVAYDGAQAIEVAGLHPPQVAVLDIGMPGMDGCELARRLRQDARHADTRLIALTGWGQAGDRERIREAGFEHHLLKPLNVSTLLGLLQD